MIVIKTSVPEGKRKTCFMHKCLERGGERGENKEDYTEYSWRWVKVRRGRSSVCETPYESEQERTVGPSWPVIALEGGWASIIFRSPAIDPREDLTPWMLPVPPVEHTGLLQSSSREGSSRKSVISWWPWRHGSVPALLPSYEERTSKKVRSGKT